MFVGILAFLEDLPAQTNLFPEFHLKTGRDYLKTISPMVERQAGGNTEILFLNARLQDQLGQKSEAERLAQQALQQDPKRSDIHLFLADLLIRQDRLEEAAQVLKQALAVDPHSQGAYRRLGMVRERLGDQPGAQTALEKAVQTSPDDALAHMLLGSLLLSQNRLEAAKTELEKACQLDPHSVNAHYALFQTLTKLKEGDRAQKALETFRELRKREKSAMDLEDAREDDGRDLRAYTVDFHRAIASQLLKQGNENLAEAHLRQGLAIAPENLPAVEMLAEFYFRKGKLAEAKPLLMQLTRLQPDNAAPHLNLGTLLLQLKDPAAVSELQRVLELSPQQPHALFYLARFYLSSRQKLPEALSLSQQLVAAQPDASSYDLLGWACYANGRTNDAIAAAAQAVKVEPANPVYRERLNRLKQAVHSPP